MRLFCNYCIWQIYGNFTNRSASDAGEYGGKSIYLNILSKFSGPISEILVGWAKTNSRKNVVHKPNPMQDNMTLSFVHLTFQALFCSDFGSR